LSCSLLPWCSRSWRIDPARSLAIAPIQWLRGRRGQSLPLGFRQAGLQWQAGAQRISWDQASIYQAPYRRPCDYFGRDFGRVGARSRDARMPGTSRGAPAVRVIGDGQLRKAPRKRGLDSSVWFGNVEQIASGCSPARGPWAPLLMELSCASRSMPGPTRRAAAPHPRAAGAVLR
jgi:hypothetical protein